jgi:hypothetical protein
MNPPAASPFVALRPVHRLADRVRYRFDLAQGTLLEPPGTSPVLWKTCEVCARCGWRGERVL